MCDCALKHRQLRHGLAGIDLPMTRLLMCLCASITTARHTSNLSELNKGKIQGAVLRHSVRSQSASMVGDSLNSSMRCLIARNGIIAAP